MIESIVRGLIAKAGAIFQSAITNQNYFSVQNLSLKYLSPESQRIVTITAC
jgi:hypothetical protein